MLNQNIHDKKQAINYCAVSMSMHGCLVECVARLTKGCLADDPYGSDITLGSHQKHLSKSCLVFCLSNATSLQGPHCGTCESHVPKHAGRTSDLLARPTWAYAFCCVTLVVGRLLWWGHAIIRVSKCSKCELQNVHHNLIKFYF